MKRNTHSLLFFFLVLLLAVPAARSTALSNAAGKYYRDLSPTVNQQKTDKDIVKFLLHRHYRNRTLDDGLASEVFDRYLEELDASRMYFMAADIKEFEAYRSKIDDELRDGRLDSGFRIYNRFQQRVADRLLFMVNFIDQGLEKLRFDVNETVQIDRKDAPWPADQVELDELWHKRLKNTVLGLKLAGKTLPEIAKTLGNRYRNQLNKINQARSEDAFQAYMNAFTMAFDPHTQYFSPRRSEDFDINMSLSFEGIGAILNTEDEYVKIVRLVAAGPAEKAKQLKPGDRIVGVGQNDRGEIVDVVGWRIDDVVQLIRGPKGTMVRLEIIPADAKDDHDTKIIKIVRNEVKLEEQSAHKKIMELQRAGRTYKIGIINIPTFYVDFKAMQSGARDYKSTTSDVRLLLKELIEAGVDGVVVDLRDNGGGSLQEANSLTGLFIRQGPTVQIRDADDSRNILRDPDPGIAYEGPLVVMVNRLSASASEIFAGAIQDYQRGIIVGGQTFGKGTVQAMFDLSQGQLKNTAAKFYRISGESTQHKGVNPDISYPSLYDTREIGESSLKGALPWDKIDSLFFRRYLNLVPLIPHLQARHEVRLKNDSNYEYLLERKAMQEEGRDEKTLSLNETVRRREYEETEHRRLTLENKLRMTKNLPLLKKLADIEEESHDIYEKSEQDPLDDAALVESGQVLLDVIELSGPDVAQR